MRLVGFDPTRPRAAAKAGQMAQGSLAAMTSRLETAIKIALTSAVGFIGEQFVSVATNAADRLEDDPLCRHWTLRPSLCSVKPQAQGLDGSEAKSQRNTETVQDCNVGAQHQGRTITISTV